MDADIKGSLKYLSKVYSAFEHNGKPMTYIQAKRILEYGLSKGYKLTSEIPDKEIERILKD